MPNSISIIIPVYNVAPYITACIQSVMSQTYQGQIECILVDDCGADNSVEIAQRMIDSYNGSIRFRLLHHNHNRGLSAARNTGIEAATGDFLYFLDSDDEISPDCISTLTTIADKYSDVEIVVGGISSEGRASIYDITRIKNRDEFMTDVKKLKKIILQGVVFPVMAWNKLIKRSFLINNKLFFKEGIIHEDVHWNFYIQRCVHSVAFAHVPTYLYRINPDGIVEKSKYNKKSEENYRIIIDDIYKSILMCEIPTVQEISYVIKYMFVYICLAGIENVKEVSYDNKILEFYLRLKYHYIFISNRIVRRILQIVTEKAFLNVIRYSIQKNSKFMIIVIFFLL